MRECLGASCLHGIEAPCARSSWSFARFSLSRRCFLFVLVSWCRFFSLPSNLVLRNPGVCCPGFLGMRGRWCYDNGVQAHEYSPPSPASLCLFIQCQVVCPAGTLKKHVRQLQAGEISSLPPPGVDGAGPATAPTGAGAAQLAEELMSQLRRAHCALVSTEGAVVRFYRWGGRFGWFGWSDLQL